MSNQAAEFEEFKRFVLSADARTLVHQLNSDIKTPLISVQNLVNVLAMMESPSPAIQKKIDSGEYNREAMVTQMTELITQVFDIIDYYRSALDNE